ncbi:MAG TPA: cysteine hydrolase [Trebonia sp.]|jgi:nicotinamidase-related amidase|nr:cysteine hydrolase [Trebonia sp.]
MTMTVSSIVPSSTALLLMDFEPAVLAAVPDPDTLLARTQAALSWARSQQVQVCYVRVAFTDEDFGAVPSHSKAFAAIAQNRFLAADSPEAQIHESLEVRDEDVVVRKTRFGAFSTTDLYASLRARGIDTLVLAGISTAGVVLSTVRHAADDDYRIYVLADATADPDPEVHRVLIEKVLPAQADVITTSDLAALSGEGLKL